MTTKCLRRAFRCYGIPVSVLSIAFTVIGGLGLAYNQDFGPIFMLAGLGALMVFSFMGARCKNHICPDCC